MGQPSHFYASPAAGGTLRCWPTCPVVSLQRVLIAAGSLWLDGQRLGPAARPQLALADRFADVTSFLAYFERWPSSFPGQLIHC